jgi:hypothetical protein
MCVCMCLYMYIYIYIYIHTYTYTYTCPLSDQGLLKHPLGKSAIYIHTYQYIVCVCNTLSIFRIIRYAGIQTYMHTYTHTHRPGVGTAPTREKCHKRTYIACVYVRVYIRTYIHTHILIFIIHCYYIIYFSSLGERV